MTCAEARGDAAVALLTRSAMPSPVADHLEGCVHCRTAVGELLPIPAMLAAAPPPDPAGGDGTMLPRLLSAAAAERRHRRYVTLLWSLAAAAGVVLLAAGLLGVLLRPTAVAPIASRSVPAAAASAVIADVLLHPLAHGAALVDVAVTGLRPGTVCTVQAVTRGGNRYPVVTWRVGNYGTGHVRGRLPADVAATDVTTVELVDARGTVLGRATPRRSRASAPG